MNPYKTNEPKVKVAARSVNVTLVPLILVSVVILLLGRALSGT